jgi:hypothetical protein
VIGIVSLSAIAALLCIFIAVTTPGQLKNFLSLMRGRKTHIGFAPWLTLLLTPVRLLWQIHSCKLDVVAALQADFKDSSHDPPTHSCKIMLLTCK